MTRNYVQALAAAAVLPVLCLDALAGDGGPFVPFASARADLVTLVDGMTIFTAADPPATAVIAGGSFSAIATATFSHLGAGTENFALGSPVNARASMGDILMIQAPGVPVGTTRLELQWRLEGEITTTMGTAASAQFHSRYEPSGVVSPTLSAGDLTFSAENPGPVDQVVTFVYDNVPVGSFWSMTTSLEASANGSVGLVNFIDTATLVGANFFVDDVRYDATVTGQSGAVYSIPEPASLVMLTLIPLALRGRALR